MLAFVARKLGNLVDELVFVGGCTTPLLVTEAAVPGLRPTDDVDCIVDVISLNEYYDVEAKLREKGFKNVPEVICRWHYEDISLDVMPTDKNILSFGNRWYKSAIKNVTTHKIIYDLMIKVVAAPYFLGTKLEAFEGRGQNDFFASHDLEDIITVINGRAEIVDEIIQVDPALKNYLAQKFSGFLSKDNFYFSLPGHLADYRSLTNARVQIVLDRLTQIANLA